MDPSAVVAGMMPGAPQMSAPPPYMHAPFAPSNQPPMPAALGVRPREWDAPIDPNSDRDKKRPRPDIPGMNVGPFNPNGPGNNNGADLSTTNGSNADTGEKDMRNNSNNNSNNTNLTQMHSMNNPNVTSFPPHMQKGPHANFPPHMHQPPPGLQYPNRPNMAGPHPGMPMPPQGRPAYPPYMTHKVPPFNRHGLQIPTMAPQSAQSGAPPGPGAQMLETSNIRPGVSVPGERNNYDDKSNNSSGGMTNNDGSSGGKSATNREPESFKEFLGKQPDSISPQEAKKLYDRYVRDFNRQNNISSKSTQNNVNNNNGGNGKNRSNKKSPDSFFDAHKDEEWFKERYDPDYVLARCFRIQKECQDRARDYYKLWRLGGSDICAPDISSHSLGCEPPVVRVEDPDYIVEDEEADEKSKDNNSESNEADANAVKKKTEEAKEETASTGNDGIKGEKNEQQGKKENKELHQEGSKKSVDENEQDSAQPADKDKEMIKNEEKTSIVKEELKDEKEETKEHKDEEKKGELEMKNEEKQSVKKELGNDVPNNSAENKSRSKGSDKAVKDKGNDKPRGKKMISLVLPLRREHEKNTIFLRGIPINLKREDLTAVLAHGRKGDKELHLRRVKIGDINPNRHLQRFAWAVYADEESASRALSIVRGVRVKSRRTKTSNGDSLDSEERVRDSDATSEYTIDCMLNLERKKKYSHGRILPEVFGTVDRMEIDVRQSCKIMRFLDKERKIDPQCNPLTDEKIESLENDPRRLDHIVTYLRETHYYCYYSGNEFLEDATSMPPQELRPVLSDKKRSMVDTDMRMAKRVDERTRWLLERDYDRPRSNSDSAEKARKDAVNAWLKANTINEGEGRYRCNLPPNKLFKAPEFVHKHLKSKHVDKMREVVDEATEKVYRSNFEKDTSKDEVISIYNEGAQSNERSNNNSGSGRSGLRTGNNGGNNGVGPNLMGGNSGLRNGNGMMGIGGGPNGNAGGGGFGGGPPGPGGINPALGGVRPAMPVGMFNPATAYMNMGMQPMPMMMMPQAAGFSYPNSMPFGRGMGGPGMGGPPPTPHGSHGHGHPHAHPGPHPQRMPEIGGPKDDMWGRPPPGGGPGHPGMPMGGPGMKDGFAPHMRMGPGVGGGNNGVSGGGGGGVSGGNNVGLRDMGPGGGDGSSGGMRGNGMQGGGPGPYHSGGSGGRRGGGGGSGGLRRGGGRGGEPLDPRAMGPRRNYTDLDAPAKGPSFDIVRYDDV